MEEALKSFQQNNTFSTLENTRTQTLPPATIITKSLRQVGEALFAPQPAQPQSVLSTVREYAWDFAKVFQRKIWRFEAERMDYQHFIDGLYCLHLLEESGQLPFPGFGSFEEFAQLLPQEISSGAKTELIKAITNFTHDIINPSGVRVIWNRGEGSTPEDFYRANGDWVVIPPATVNQEHLTTIVKPEIIDEVLQFLASGHTIVPRHRHYTTTAAITDIQKQKSLLSTRLLNKRGVNIVSGERFTNFGLTDDKKHGHIHVYAYHPEQTEHHTPLLRWFNEAPILFHISEGDHLHWTKTSGIMTTLYKPQAAAVLQRSSNAGILMGPIVPLQNIALANTWHRNLTDLEFLSEYGVRIVSLEAYKLLTEHRRSIQTLADNEQISETEAWIRLLDFKI